jgi:hypothetical protein
VATGADVRTAEMFADIVYSDQGWVDLEFEAMVAGFYGAVKSTRVVSRQPSLRGTRFGNCDRRSPARRVWSHRTRATIRSPPLRPRISLMR